jgi:hypothetical protein
LRILLIVAGVLNIISGIGAIGDAKFFIANQKYIISSLHIWGWVTLVLGVLELLAGFSLCSGGDFGRWVGSSLPHSPRSVRCCRSPATRSGRCASSPRRSSSSTSWPIQRWRRQQRLQPNAPTGPRERRTTP